MESKSWHHHVIHHHHDLNVMISLPPPTRLLIHTSSRRTTDNMFTVNRPRDSWTETVSVSYLIGWSVEPAEPEPAP